VGGVVGDSGASTVGDDVSSFVGVGVDGVTGATLDVGDGVGDRGGVPDVCDQTSLWFSSQPVLAAQLFSSSALVHNLAPAPLQ